MGLRDEKTNSAGALSQHLCGNLTYFIGSAIDKTGYTRNRNLKFSETGFKRE